MSFRLPADQNRLCVRDDAAHDAGGFPGLPAANAGALQFWSLGDQGTGNWGPHKQGDVADAMAEVLPRYPGSQFTLGLGDNFYLRGVRDVHDPQWQEKFESVYPRALGAMPFYPVVGDHDHCLNASALVWDPV